MTGMRVLVATDGSACSQVALDLTRNIRWPDGTVLHVVSAVEPQVAAYSPSVVGAVGDGVERQTSMIGAVQNDLERVASTLTRSGLDVESHVILGRAASAIVDSANSLGADLIIVGSRGHGTITSMVLGSVSAEVADHAHCPVLVARKTSWGQAVLATDGSSFARTAEDVVAQWPIFADATVAVLAVADTDLIWPSAFALSGYPATLDYRAEAQAVIDEHHQFAEDSTARLRGVGRNAAARHAEGDPATVVIKSAGSYNADVIVVGTHGTTGVHRALVGSVSRNVMLHAPCSVLVVREVRAAN